MATLPQGSDEYIASDGWDDPKLKETMDDTVSLDFSNGTAELFKRLMVRLSGMGIRAIPTPSGQWCGFEFYKQAPLVVEGMRPPEGFTYLRSLSPSDESDRLIVKDAIQSIAAAECRGGVDKQTAGKWMTFVENLTVGMANPRNLLSGIAASFVTTKPYRVRTFSGLSGHYVVVPLREWFSPEVQEVDVYELLSILPEPEAEFFLLNLGRIICGANESISAEGILRHEYRYFIGLTGGAGLGKSTLMDRFLKPALMHLGCVIEAWNTGKDNKFGWARRACSDAYFLSDVKSKDTLRVIDDPQQKILSSGEMLVTEEKGMPSITIHKPTAGGFVFCCNNLDISGLMCLDDSGVTDRFRALYCRESSELRHLYGEEKGLNDKKALAGMTGLLWERKARELGVTTETLAMWLICNAAERFFDACNYKVINNQLIQEAPSGLKKAVSDITGLLRFETADSAKANLIDAIKYGITYTLHNYNAQECQAFFDHIHELELSYNLIACAVALSCKVPPSELQGDNEWQTRFTIKGLAVTTVTPFFEQNSKNIWHAVDKLGDPQSAFEEVIKILKNRNGFGYPKSPASYNSLWRSALVEVQFLYLDEVQGQPNYLTGTVRKHIQDYDEYVQAIISKYYTPPKRVFK